MTDGNKETDVAVLQEKVETIEVRQKHLEDDIKDVEERKHGPSEKCREAFASKEAFSLVQKIVFGAVALVLTAFMIGILALGFKK